MDISHHNPLIFLLGRKNLYMQEETNYRVGARFRHLIGKPIENAELYLTVAGIERCAPDKFYGPGIRNDYHLHFIISGKGTLEINNTSYKLKRGEIFIIPPYVETFYYADSKDPWQYAWISFAGTKATYYLEKAGLTTENPIRKTYVEPEEFLTLIEKLLNHHELIVANELLRTSLMYEILALLINSQNQNLSNQNKPIPHDYSPTVYVEHAVEYIHYNYNRIRVNDIAEYIGISRSYLTHIFKKQLQVSPQEYLLTYRLEQSCKLLRTTNLPIQDIAEKVGYENPLTFSKIFKSAYGCSPKNYRTRILEENTGQQKQK